MPPQEPAGPLPPSGGRSQDRRFAAALVCYAALALMAGLTLDGLLRTAVWILLGGLVVKTWLAWRADR